MIMNCPHCGNAIESDFDLVSGQRVLCPYCEMKFVYDNDHSASENTSAREAVVTRRRIGGRTAIALFAAAIVMVVVAPCVIMCTRWIGSPADKRVTINANQSDEVLAAKAYESFMEGDTKKASRYAEAIRDEASRIILVSTFKDLERTTREESRKRAIAVDALTDEEGDKARTAADSIREDTIMSIGE